MQDTAREAGHTPEHAPADAQGAEPAEPAEQGVVRGGAAAALQGEGVDNPLKETLASRVDKDEVEAARAEVERRRAQISVQAPRFTDTLRSANPLELSEPTQPSSEDAPAGSIPVESAPSDREFALPDSEQFAVVELPVVAEPSAPDGLGSSEPTTIRRGGGPVTDAAVAEPPAVDTDGGPSAPAPTPPSDGPTLPCRQSTPPSDEPTPPSDEEEASTHRRGAGAEPPPSSTAPSPARAGSKLWLRVFVLLVLAGLVALVLARGLGAGP